MFWLTPYNVYSNLLTLRYKLNKIFNVRPAAINNGLEVFRLLKSNITKYICAFLVLNDIETNFEAVCFCIKGIEVFQCILNTPDEVAQSKS
jgi:hypothetical protein